MNEWRAYQSVHETTSMQHCVANHSLNLVDSNNECHAQSIESTFNKAKMRIKVMQDISGDKLSEVIRKKNLKSVTSDSLLEILVVLYKL